MPAGRHPGSFTFHHRGEVGLGALGSIAQPTPATPLMRLEGFRLEGLALFANAPAPGRKEGQMVSKIRVEGIALSFLHHDSQLPSSAAGCPSVSREGMSHRQEKEERSWGGRAGPVLAPVQDGGMRGGCYRSEKQAQK